MSISDKSAATIVRPEMLVTFQLQSLTMQTVIFRPILTQLRSFHIHPIKAVDLRNHVVLGGPSLLQPEKDKEKYLMINL
jgi:hypothetical protein